MRTREIKRQAFKALDELHKLFSATHWTKGTYQTADWAQNKETFCLVGGVEFVTGHRTAMNEKMIPGDVKPLRKNAVLGLPTDVGTCIATVIASNPKYVRRITAQNHPNRIDKADVDKFMEGWESYGQRICVAFNDARATTKDELLAVLEEAKQFEVIHYRGGF